MNDLIGEWPNIIVAHVRHAFQCNSLTWSAKWRRDISTFDVLTTMRARSDKSFILCLDMQSALWQPYRNKFKFYWLNEGKNNPARCVAPNLDKVRPSSAKQQIEIIKSSAFPKPWASNSNLKFYCAFMVQIEARWWQCPIGLWLWFLIVALCHLKKSIPQIVSDSKEKVSPNHKFNFICEKRELLNSLRIKNKKNKNEIK